MGTRAVYFSKIVITMIVITVSTNIMMDTHRVRLHALRMPRHMLGLCQDRADSWAAFVAANKNPKGGEVRLLPNFEHTSIP